MSYEAVIQELNQNAIADNVPFLQKFFKTGKGQYGEGDQFIGVRVPPQRAIARKYQDISLGEVEMLLSSPIHEHRLTALIILTHQYKKAKTLENKKKIFDFYIAHIPYINNWDLVDTSTHKIVGPYLHETGNFDYLYTLAQDELMWSKRIAVVALWFLWKKGYIQDGLQLLLLNIEHPHDLMHKANGWMLRELGKINEDAMLEFIFMHYDQLPRTTLRYAIEKIKEPLRTTILKKQF